MTVRDSLSFVYAEHFQPECVPFAFVSDKVRAFDFSLRPIAPGEVDQMRALRAEDIHSKAQILRLGVIIQGFPTASSDR
jgi:hypothetical protein